MPLPPIADSHLEALCNIIGDTYGGLTGSEIGRLLQRCGIEDPFPGDTKRRRLFSALQVKQRQDKCANNVVLFIQTVMEPVRFVGRHHEFAGLRGSLNEVLVFAGYQIGEGGKLAQVSQARTLTEAQQRAGKLRNDLIARRVHPDVLSFCRAELLQDNYFHAVFEATKSVAQKIRDKTGLTGDGSDIVDKAFSISDPLIAINSLRTETEQSEHKGFANLLRGTFGTFRNVTGHAPKVTWSISEEDALDLLTIVSYLHRKLDKAIKVPKV